MSKLRIWSIGASLIFSGFVHAFLLGGVRWPTPSATESKGIELEVRLWAGTEPDLAVAGKMTGLATSPANDVDTARPAALKKFTHAVPQTDPAPKSMTRKSPEQAASRKQIRQPVNQSALDSESISDEIRPDPQDRAPLVRAQLTDQSDRGRAKNTKPEHFKAAGSVLSGKALAATEPTIESAARTDPDTDADEELLQLLNQTIAASRHYPRIARRQGREGTARIAFTMNPDGVVSAVEIVSSTEFSPLDHAAVGAVSAISPFQPATKYLRESKTFNIAVRFSLK